MSFKFNKKAVITGLSSTEADKILVYAQTIKRISSQSSFSVDRNIFCVDVGAAALKKQSKTDCKWVQEELENARIIPGAVITVSGKERYVKTEVCDHELLLNLGFSLRAFPCLWGVFNTLVKNKFTSHLVTILLWYLVSTSVVRNNFNVVTALPRHFLTYGRQPEVRCWSLKTS